MTETGVCLTQKTNANVKSERQNGIHVAVVTQPDTRMPQQGVEDAVENQLTIKTFINVAMRKSFQRV